MRCRTSFSPSSSLGCAPRTSGFLVGWVAGSSSRRGGFLVGWERRGRSSSRRARRVPGGLGARRLEQQQVRAAVPGGLGAPRPEQQQAHVAGSWWAGSAAAGAAAGARGGFLVAGSAAAGAAAGVRRRHASPSARPPADCRVPVLRARGHPPTDHIHDVLEVFEEHLRAAESAAAATPPSSKRRDKGTRGRAPAVATTPAPPARSSPESPEPAAFEVAAQEPPSLPLLPSCPSTALSPATCLSENDAAAAAGEGESARCGWRRRRERGAGGETTTRALGQAWLRQNDGFYRFRGAIKIVRMRLVQAWLMGLTRNQTSPCCITQAWLGAKPGNQTRSTSFEEPGCV